MEDDDIFGLSSIDTTNDTGKILIIQALRRLGKSMTNLEHKSEEFNVSSKLDSQWRETVNARLTKVENTLESSRSYTIVTLFSVLGFVLWELIKGGNS